MELSSTSGLVTKAAPLRDVLLGAGLQFRPSFPFSRSRFSLPISVSGTATHKRALLIASASEGPSSEPSENEGKRTGPVEKNALPNLFQDKILEEEFCNDDENQLKPLFEFLENFNIKLDLEDTYSILLYGGASFVSLWLLAAIVGAVDSIPLFPKLMEVVGLSFSLWFTTRYLIFKRDRDELRAKIEEFKQEVLGSDDSY